MAVTQISRIQHRRGLDQDLPQLAGAELGWSVDTRRLYIGNGTIDEGAPAQGITEVLTQYTDLAALIGSYTFKGNITESYPFNPNGSRNGIAGICSKNGRHLAIMPHPERSYFKWQIPWIPKNCLKKYSDYTPWKKIFELN